MCKSFCMKLFQTKNTVPYNVYFFAGGGGAYFRRHIFIPDFTIGKAVVLQYLIYYHGQYKWFSVSYNDIILNVNHRLHLFKYWPLHSGTYQNTVTNCNYGSLTTSYKIGLHGQGRHPAIIRTKLELQNNDRPRKYTSYIMIVIEAYNMLLCNVGFNMFIFDNNKIRHLKLKGFLSLRIRSTVQQCPTGKTILWYY